jgi:hypothetical protein
MAVISDSVTASEMRDEMLEVLESDYAQAAKECSRKQRTQRDQGFKAGYAAALNVQIDFWRHVWIDNKQALPPT